MIFSLFEIHLDSLTHINSGHKNQKESLTQSYGQGRDSGGIESKVESYRVWTQAMYKGAFPSRLLHHFIVLILDTDTFLIV